MADNELILVTGAAGQLGAVGRTVTGLLLDRGLPVRALVRREDERAAALRAVGAEVVVGDLLEPADDHAINRLAHGNTRQRSGDIIRHNRLHQNGRQPNRCAFGGELGDAAHEFEKLR